MVIVRKEENCAGGESRGLECPPAEETRRRVDSAVILFDSDGMKQKSNGSRLEESTALLQQAMASLMQTQSTLMQNQS
jgi:hypothetical protein